MISGSCTDPLPPFETTAVSGIPEAGTQLALPAVMCRNGLHALQVAEFARWKTGWHSAVPESLLHCTHGEVCTHSAVELSTAVLKQWEQYCTGLVQKVKEKLSLWIRQGCLN